MGFKALLLALLLTFHLAPALADVCVWRDPERTMARLFPQARDYRTVTYKLTPAQVEQIGRLGGTPLTPGESREYDIYEITDGQRVIGRVLALAGEGEYGTIETVLGIGPDHRIRGVYVQRIRERQRDAVQSEAFLGQFRNGSLEPELKIAAPSGAEKAAQVITVLVRKMLAYDHVLSPKQP